MPGGSVAGCAVSISLFRCAVERWFAICLDDIFLRGELDVVFQFLSEVFLFHVSRADLRGEPAAIASSLEATSHPQRVW